MMRIPRPGPGTARTWTMLGAIAGLVVISGAALARLAAGPGNGSEGLPLYTVRRGPLTINVTESGTIKALDQRIIKSEVEGQTTIISLVDEGTVVQEGDLLVQLDVSTLEDQKVEQQIRMQNAEAAFIRSREQFEVVKSQNASDISRAELDSQFAQEDLTRYFDGQYPNELNAARTKVTLADEELKRATDKYDWSKTLFDQKYVSESEYRADELAQKRSALEKDLAEASLKLLEEYTHTRTLIELKAEIEQKKMTLDRVRRKAAADLVQAEADLKAKNLEFQQQRDKLAKIDDQIRKTVIHAPVGGMVVYATSAQGNWRGNAEPLDEGQTVRERQELIYLPTADAMMAEIKIHESSLEKVRTGLPVEVRIDALPHAAFRGTVVRIAPLPDAQSMWLNPDLKVFSTDIHIQGSARGLRTGMSCEATIIVQRYEDVLYVPVQTVVRRGGDPVVYVPGPGGPEPRLVEIGLANNTMIHIKAGLEPGEKILLTPPLGSGIAPAADPVEVPSPDPPAGGAEAPARDSAPETSSPEPGPQGPGAGEAPQRGRPDRGAGEQGSRELSPDDREQRRRRFENLPEEERQKLREQLRQRRRQEENQGSQGPGDGSESQHARGRPRAQA